MKAAKYCIAISIIALFFASCNKKCRCYRRDGDVVEFTMEELDERNTTCALMENENFGLTYSLCEHVY